MRRRPRGEVEGGRAGDVRVDITTGLQSARHYRWREAGASTTNARGRCPFDTAVCTNGPTTLHLVTPFSDGHRAAELAAGIS